MPKEKWLYLKELESKAAMIFYEVEEWFPFNGEKNKVDLLIDEKESIK